MPVARGELLRYSFQDGSCRILIMTLKEIVPVILELLPAEKNLIIRNRVGQKCCASPLMC